MYVSQVLESVGVPEEEAAAFVAEDEEAAVFVTEDGAAAFVLRRVVVTFDLKRLS